MSVSNNRSDIDGNASTFIFSQMPKRHRQHLSCIHGVEPKKLADWAESLNVLNLSETVPSMMNLLQELAELDLLPSQVFVLYQIISQALDRIQNTIKRQYAQKGLLLSAAAKKCLEMGHTLDKLSAVLFKVLLRETVDVREPSSSRDWEMAVFAGHYMSHVTGIFLRLSNFYLMLPKGFWRDCHGVYAFVLENGGHDCMLKDFRFLHHERDVTVEQLYIALVLYSIQEPSRFDRRLHEPLWHCLLNMAPLVSLHKNMDPEDVFSIVFTDDVGHVPDRAIKSELDDGQLMFISVGKLVKKVTSESLTASKFTNNKKLEMVLPSIVENFTRERYRLQPRFEAQFEADGFIGLLNVYKHLCQISGHPDTSAIGEQIDYSSLGSVRATHERFIITDESEGGYQVRTREPSKRSFDSGDLIFLSAVDLSQLCIIRWTKLSGSAFYSMGLEKLASKVDAIECLVVDSGLNSVGVFEKGLMFDQHNKIVVMTRVAAAPGQELHIKLHGDIEIFGVAEVHWLVSGYVLNVLKRL